jgi:hypothetical protein
MNTRSSTKQSSMEHSKRISKRPEKFSDFQLSLNKGKYHGHVDTYDRHQIQLEVSEYLEKKKDDLHGYSDKDGFVVNDQVIDQELSFDDDEESVKSDDDDEEEEEELDLESESDESDFEEDE